MASKRPRKLSALVASSLVLVLTGQAPAALADTPAQLQRCYETLATLSESPLRTLDRYPGYLLQRHENLAAGTAASAELTQCEARLSDLVADNRQRFPGLLNRLCSQTERAPQDYAGLQTYLMGIPDMHCENDWFDALTPAQWQQLQPQLARISNLEHDCTRALAALAREGRLREQFARTTARLISLSRQVFSARWRTTLAGLPEPVAAALVEREQQLAHCERLLSEQLATAHVE